MNIEYTEPSHAIKDFIEGQTEKEVGPDCLNYLILGLQGQKIAIKDLFIMLQSYYTSTGISSISNGRFKPSL
jgi:hypothetical protein